VRRSITRCSDKVGLGNKDVFSMTQNVELPASDETLHESPQAKVVSPETTRLVAAPELHEPMGELSKSGEQATNPEARLDGETSTVDRQLSVEPRELEGGQPARSPKLPLRVRSKAKAKTPASPPVHQPMASPVNNRTASAKHLSLPRPKSLTLNTRPASSASSEKQTMTTDVDNSPAKTPFAKFQEQAQAALSKGTAALNGASDLAKGNLEATLASGRILTAGLRDISAAMAAESRGALEAITGDARKLAAATSPAEFFQLQNSLARKQFEGAISQASKNVETLFRLTSEMMAPLSNQMVVTASKIGGSV